MFLGKGISLQERRLRRVPTKKTLFCRYWLVYCGI